MWKRRGSAVEAPVEAPCISCDWPVSSTRVLFLTKLFLCDKVECHHVFVFSFFFYFKKTKLN